MTEEFLHYIWKFQLMSKLDVVTTSGENLCVQEVGIQNTDAGPDFFNGKLQIGETIWGGNIEIHIKSSDWNRHNHQTDKAYSNVILHVVYIHDKEVYTSDGRRLQTLELKNVIDKTIEARYQRLIQHKKGIHCENLVKDIDSFTWKNWQERLVVERLESKIKSIETLLIETNDDWEEAFYIHLMISFGQKVNSLPFELLAKSLGLKKLIKHKNSLFQLEALLLGQAGFFEKECLDDYAKQLHKEYTFLKTKYSLEPLENHVWKFSRLRPANFPTVRIAQFAVLIHRSANLFSNLVESNSLSVIRSILQVELTGYWNDHYQLGRRSKSRKKRLGKSSVDLLIINTIIPFMFIYGRDRGKPHLSNQVIHFLEQIPPESNRIIRQWKSCGVKIESSFHSQAMLQLSNEYCKQTKCLRCAIGNKILRN